MAIFKPSFCSPYEGSFSIENNSGDVPIYIECQLDTSNTLVNGYSIELYDENKNRIFPTSQSLPEPADGTIITSIYNWQNQFSQIPTYVSSIDFSGYGRNGTLLKIPFVVDSITGQTGNFRVANNQILKTSLTNLKTYIWKITLYQLSNSTTQASTYAIPPSSVCCDQNVTTGTILGSNNKRIQGLKSDKIFSEYFIQPVHIPSVNAGTGQSYNPKSWSYDTQGEITNVGSRAMIESYDSTNGYIYPVQGSDGIDEKAIKYDPNNTQVANGFQIYKMSNRADDLNTYQKVDAAPRGIIPWIWNSSTETPGDSYGRQEYYIDQYQHEKNQGVFYPFDIIKSSNWQSNKYDKQIAQGYPESSRPNHTNGWTISKDPNGKGIVMMAPWNSNTRLIHASGDNDVTWITTPMYYRNGFGSERYTYWVGLTNERRICLIKIGSDPQNYEIVTQSTLDTIGKVQSMYITGEDNNDATSDAQGIPKIIANTSNGLIYMLSYDSVSAQAFTYSCIGTWDNSILMAGTSTQRFKIIGSLQYGQVYEDNGAENVPTEQTGIFALLKEYNSIQLRYQYNIVKFNPSGSDLRSKWTNMVTDITDGDSKIDDLTGLIINKSNPGAYELDSSSGSEIYIIDPSWSFISLNLDGSSSFCRMFDDRDAIYTNFNLTISSDDPIQYYQRDRFDNIIVITSSACYVSHDCGKTFERIFMANSDENIISLDYLHMDADYFSFSVYNSKDKTTNIYIFLSSISSIGQSLTIDGKICVSPSFHALSVEKNIISSNQIWYINLSTQDNSNGYIPLFLIGNNHNQYWIWDSEKTFAINSSKSQRIVLNYQSTTQNSHTELLNNTAVGAKPQINIASTGSQYNGIYYASITTEDTGSSRIKVIVNWIRTPDADSWGELSTKIVLVNPQTASSSMQNYSDYLGKNIQINFTSSATSGIINETPFKFGPERPVEIYNLSQTQGSVLNTTGLIFYNHADDSVGTLYLRPFVGLKAGDLFAEIGNSQKTFSLTHIDDNEKNGTWGVNYSISSPTIDPSTFTIDESRYHISTYHKTSDEYRFVIEPKPTIVNTQTDIDGAGVQLEGTYTYPTGTLVSWKGYQFQIYSDSNRSDLIFASDVNTNGAIKSTFYLVPGETYYTKLAVETNSGREIEYNSNFTISNITESTSDWTIGGQLTSPQWSINMESKYAQMKIILPTHIDDSQAIGENNEYFNIFRREYWKNQLGVIEYQKYYTPIALNVNQVGSPIYDFGISNHANYEYMVCYYDGSSWSCKKIMIESHWNGFVIMSLDNMTQNGIYSFASSSLKDTWKFALNLDIGGEQLNMSHATSDTLGIYPIVSYGQKRYRQGSVQALLGQGCCCETQESRYIEDIDTTIGQKRRISNGSIDKLNAWNKFCASANPKVIKDDKGSIMLVQITSTNSQVHNQWNYRPEDIGFEWIEIGKTDNLSITNV